MDLRLARTKAAPSDLAARRALAGVYAKIAGVQFEVAPPEVAASWRRLALAEHERAALEGGADADLIEVAADHAAIGRYYGETADTEKALGHSETADRGLRAFLKKHPGDPRARRDLALTLYQAAMIRIKGLAQVARAIAEFDQAEGLLTGLIGERPRDIPLRLDQALVLYQAGCALDQLSRDEDALGRYAGAMAALAPVLEAYPTSLEARRAEADLHAAVGIALANLGRQREAIVEHGLARDLFEAMIREDPGVPIFRLRLGACFCSLSISHEAVGEDELARSYIGRSIEIREALARQDPSTTVYRALLADDHGQFGRLERKANRAESARASYRKAIDLLEALPSGNLLMRYNLACYLASSAELTPEPGERGRLADRAMAQLRAAVATGYANAGLVGTDRDLDVLRGRDDFRSLLMDLAFPVDPFAR